MLTMPVAASVTYFDPQPAADELPARMPTPFAAGTPHRLAVRAADALRRELAAGLGARLGIAQDGKMFGVFVVRDLDGRIGYLRAFSGMAGGTWEVPGFVGPAFDLATRDGFWIDGEAELIAIADEIVAVDAELAPHRAELDALLATHAAEIAALHAVRRANKAKRDAIRATTSDPDTLAALARESYQDTNKRQHVEKEHRYFEAQRRAPVTALEERRARLVEKRAARSRDYLVRIHNTYRLANARGEIRALRDLFAPAEPPGGAGDCAAPKLLAHAYRHGLRPIALAEVWCGAPPATGDRRDGAFYPACRGKCGPILGHMLEGLVVDPSPVYGEDAVDPAAPLTLFEDEHLAVVAKPVGLLSVPGRSSRADSVLARLRVRYPDATGPLLPHRLDLDTSGLMLVAKDERTHGALQRQFAERTIEKRYIAVLDGEARADGGTIELPIRVDLDDRPRQIVDAVHGKPAVTDWRVVGREPGRTRVALYPRTGRAHQLRVHAAHPQGIGVPIVGDRLYGRPDVRLLLHAEAVVFVHPHSQKRLTFELAAPF